MDKVWVGLSSRSARALQAPTCLRWSRLALARRSAHTPACASRRPAKRDMAKLADDSITELKGLAAGIAVEVIAVDTGRLSHCVRLPDLQTPSGPLVRLQGVWFEEASLVLADPEASQPPPCRPKPHECCGSSCPRCVWIVFREEQRAWNAADDRVLSGMGRRALNALMSTDVGPHLPPQNTVRQA